MHCQQREAIIHPFYPTLLHSHLEGCVQVWAPLHKKDRELLERVHRRATEMNRVLEQLLYEDRLTELDLFCQENSAG